MDLKEVKKFLKENEEGKAYLESQVEEAIDGLKNKNGELIATNKTLKQERDEAKSKFSELEEELDDLRKSKNVDVQGEIDKAIKRVNKEKEELQTKLNNSDSRIQKLVVETGLAEAIAKANIAKQHASAVKALIRSENKIEIDETDNTAKIDGKPLAEFISTWVQGDVGKHYIAAPDNRGGGAGGPGGGKSHDDIMKLSPIERMKSARR